MTKCENAIKVANEAKLESIIYFSIFTWKEFAKYFPSQGFLCYYKRSTLFAQLPCLIN